MVLLGGILYGMMSSFVKLSYAKGYNAAELSFYQALLAALFLGVCALCSRKKQKAALSGQKLLPLILAGSAIGLTNFLYYLSVQYIAASLAIVILMQFTWFCLLIEWLCFGKKPSGQEIGTVFIVWGGTVMAGNLFSGATASFSWKGFLFAALSSLTYALYIVANSRTGKDMAWPVKSTLIMVGSALTIFCINFRTIIWDNHFSPDFFGRIAFLAILGTTLPTALFAVGIPKIGAGISAILMTIELPTAVLCAHLILNEDITFVQMSGLLVMVSSISWMNFRKSRSKALKQLD